MTTQTVHIQTFDYGASLTSATLRAIDTDTLVATADTTDEVTADSGLYAVVFGEVTAITAGTYRLRAVAGGQPINRYVTLAGVDAEVVQSRSERFAELPPNSITAAVLATDAVSEIQSGLATPTNITQAIGITLAPVTHTGATIPTVTTVTNGVTLAATQPAITFGAVTIDVSGSTPNITLTGSGSGNGIEWTRSGSGDPLDADVVDQIQSGLSTLDASGVRSAVGLASANLDTQLGDIPTFAEFEARSIVAANYATSSVLSTVEGKIDTIDNFINTEVLAIKAVTDKIDTGLVLDGPVWQFTANMLELGPSGGGGSSVNVLPATGIVADRSAGTTLLPVVGETISQAITVYQSDGTTAVNLSGKTLTIIFETLSGTDVAVVLAANIIISGASSNVVTFAYPTAVTASERVLRFAIRDAAAPKTMYLQGVCSVVAAPSVDA